MNEGEIVSSRGLRIPATRFEEEFHELQVPHSHALHSVRREGGSYLVGPMARYALNRDRLGPGPTPLRARSGWNRSSRTRSGASSSARSRSSYACEEALRIIGRVPCRPPNRSSAPRARSMSPAGMCRRHRGAARPPVTTGTALDPGRPDRGGEDRRADVPEPEAHRGRRPGRGASAPSTSTTPALTDACERAIRNHDPCISCATHFLTLDLQRN